MTADCPRCGHPVDPADPQPCEAGGLCDLTPLGPGPSMMPMTAIQITAAQAIEVESLLDTVRDENTTEPDSRIVWGELAGLTLTVLDAEEAVEELEERADHLAAQGWEHGDREGLHGNSLARSLRSLAKKVAAA